MEVLAIRFERGGGKLESSRTEASVRTRESELFRGKSSNISSGEPSTISPGSASTRIALKVSGRCNLGPAVYL